MRVTTNFLAGLALAASASCGQAAEIQLGSMTLDWPTGYLVKSTKPPFELTGPSGAKVLVTVMRLGAGASGSPEALAKLKGMTEGMLTEQARKAGKVSVPLGAETLPDGTRLQFIGSDVSRMFRTGYLLQYTLIAEGGGQLALLTFEGPGDAAAEHERVKALFNTVRWQAGEGTAAERAAFTDKVAALLRARPEGLAVVVSEPLTLKIGDLQANLDRVYSFCRANADGCDAELRRYADGVVEAGRNVAAPVTREAVRVVIRPADYVDKSLPSGAGKVPSLPRAFVPGLVALAALDAPRTMRMLGEADAKALGMSPEQLHELGLANLRSLLKPLAEVAPPVRPGAIGSLRGDYEPGRLLLLADWAPLAQAQQGQLVVALPTRDLLLYSADDSPAGLDALRTLARETAQRSPTRLSDLLLRWSEAGWQVVR